MIKLEFHNEQKTAELPGIYYAFAPRFLNTRTAIS